MKKKQETPILSSTPKQTSSVPPLEPVSNAKPNLKFPIIIAGIVVFIILFGAVIASSILNIKQKPKQETKSLLTRVTPTLQRTNYPPLQTPVSSPSASSTYDNEIISLFQQFTSWEKDMRWGSIQKDIQQHELNSGKYTLHGFSNKGTVTFSNSDQYQIGKSRPNIKQEMEKLGWIREGYLDANGPGGDVYGFKKYERERELIIQVDSETKGQGGFDPQSGFSCPCIYTMKVFASEDFQPNEIPVLYNNAIWNKTVLEAITIHGNGALEGYVTDASGNYQIPAFYTTSQPVYGIPSEFINYYKKELEKRGWIETKVNTTVLPLNTTEFAFSHDSYVGPTYSFIIGYTLQDKQANKYSLFIRHD